jgi:translocation and assembly module TamB
MMKAQQVAIPNKIYLNSLQADFVLAEGREGKLEGSIALAGLSAIAPVALSSEASAEDESERFSVKRLQANLSGLRHAHTLQVLAALSGQQQIAWQAQGDLQEGTNNIGVQWVGKMLSANLSGPLDFQLLSPFDLHLSRTAVQIGENQWRGKLGRLHLQQFHWTPGQLTTRGQFQAVPIVQVLKLWRANLPLAGQLLLDASWQLEMNQQLAGQVQIQRTRGDLTIYDKTGGPSQAIPLGLQSFMIKVDLGSEAQRRGAPVQVVLQAQGSQLGKIDVNVLSYLNKTGLGWTWPDTAPLAGQVTLQINNIGWMSQLLGAGIDLHGVLDAHAQLAGSLSQPDYRATIKGKELNVFFTELGVLLPNGNLDVTIENHQLTLHELKFIQTIKAPPKHDERLSQLSWVNGMGSIEASGSLDLQTGRSFINAAWQKFPFLQSADNWLAASGQAQLSQSNKDWRLSGEMVADAAYFSVAKQAPPRLSNDVVVLKKNGRPVNDKSDSLQINLDFNMRTGPHFIFVGRGINARLDGDMRIRSKNGGSLLASGSIHAVDGSYEGYGQQLTIDRGILNFQGPIDNPGLNVRAVRRGLPVEAGVEVLGTVARPEVHLISEPNVPDQDKLSWLALGRGSDQTGGEALVLLSAARAIFGVGEGGNIPTSLTQNLGLDGLSIGTGTTQLESQLPSQTVAGAISSAPSDQVLTVGKRIAPNLVFSIERSLTDASNGFKLTWQLTRRFSVIGRAGSDTALDGQYVFSFD